MLKEQETIDELYSIYNSAHAEVHFTLGQMDALSEAMRVVEAPAPPHQARADNGCRCHEGYGNEQRP